MAKNSFVTEVIFKAHKFYKSLMFIQSHIFLVQPIMVKIKIISSHQAECSYPAFFKLL